MRVVKDMTLDDHDTSTMADQKPCPTASDADPSLAKESISKVCEHSQDHLLELWQALWLDKVAQVQHGRRLGYKVKRHTKRREKANPQEAYRDAMILLKDIIKKYVAGPYSNCGPGQFGFWP
jgi:hypothetical protein